MGKNLPSVMGFPVAFVLSDLANNTSPDELKDFLNRRGLEINDLNVSIFQNAVRKVLNRLNVGICMTEAQYDGVIDQLLQLNTMDALLSKGPSIVLATYVNSFHLECQNCLNIDCARRDPAAKVA